MRGGNHIRRTAVCGIAAAVLLGVAPAQTPDRTSPPAPGPPAPFSPPNPVVRALANGVPVWIVSQPEVPVVQVSLVVRAGAGTEAPAQLGLASVTADLLDEGAGSRTSLEIADAIDLLGADLSSSSGYDATTIRLHVSSARVREALAVMADVVQRPTFPPEELERLRQERLTALLQARDNPVSIVQAAFPYAVFGPEHRYGRLTLGTPDTLRAFTAADPRAFHARHYVPDNATLIVVGDISADEATTVLGEAFGTWSGEAAPEPPPIPESPQLTARQVWLVDKPGAAQSQIRIGRVGVARSTPDYYALQVLNTVLGGSFTSRLNQNLREEHGYSYGAGSAFDMRLHPGPFFAAAGVQTDKTSEAVKEFFKELTDIATPIPEAELDRAKSYLIRGFPADFETTRAIAARFEPLAVYGLPASYYNLYVRRVQEVTAADVQRAAAKYIQPDTLAVVIVGDRETIEAGVRALELGPVRVLSLDDVMGADPGSSRQERGGLR